MGEKVKTVIYAALLFFYSYVTIVGKHNLILAHYSLGIFRLQYPVSHCFVNREYIHPKDKDTLLLGGEHTSDKHAQ